ncbi:hypothetical protein [Tenacibaculum retecalamus]|uniref:hypothetical protein n=1 Tax=Tenacibaculum retecalamus TaxID=3018315 RepID=UPI0023D964CE|nr:hypothetical protein [Tenacibaculum retecalamus]WBX70570.1 hypothetical protein PG912_09895 [Tenacibaculum retecalamus]
MTNPYKKHLDIFFESIIDLKHTAKRLNKVLLQDVERYTTEKTGLLSGTALIIGDWTASTDNGYKINFHTGIKKSTFKENYSLEIENILSREFGLAFAQSFEAFEKLLKDSVYIKIQTDTNFREDLKPDKDYSRKKLSGGDEIFKLIKKACGKEFTKYSKQNNNNFKLSEFFKIISEVRHSMIHCKGKLETSKIPKDKYYKSLFEHLFSLNKLENEIIELKLNYKLLDKLLIYISEFGFQFFKFLSEVDNYEWKI